MNILQSNFEILEQQYNKNDLKRDMFKHIEICGRNCYKSEDKITDDSYIGFVDRLIKSKHGAMLEHGTVYLTIPVLSPTEDPDYMRKIDTVEFFKKNKYSRVKEAILFSNKKIDVHNKEVDIKVQITCYYITTNYRVIAECDEDIVEAFDNYSSKKTKLSNYIEQFMCEPTYNHVKRHTVAFTYHLAVARDVNRHRTQSIAEESTRYCDYTKEKFGNGLNVIKPLRIEQDSINDLYYSHYDEDNLFQSLCEDFAKGKDLTMSETEIWLFVNLACQRAYELLKVVHKWSNQECSLILPLDTKTCSIHTAFDDDWVHFFNLRALGTTGAPRPSIKKLATELMEIFIKNKWIKTEDLSSTHYIKYLEGRNQNNG